jgi:preprotein translocase subunit SecF
LLKMTRRTYGEAANLAVNQTLMRSINTSLIALLPVLGLLVVGVGILGTGTLTDLALVQLVGMMSGALSSICLATPLLVDFKMTEQPFKQHAAKVMAKRRALANKGAGEEDELDVTDDGAVASEVRKERAMAAASAVPARHGKTAPRPAGKSARPTGKKRR